MAASVSSIGSSTDWQPEGDGGKTTKYPAHRMRLLQARATRYSRPPLPMRGPLWRWSPLDDFYGQRRKTGRYFNYRLEGVMLYPRRHVQSRDLPWRRPGCRRHGCVDGRLSSRIVQYQGASRARASDLLDRRNCHHRGRLAHQGTPIEFVWRLLLRLISDRQSEVTMVSPRCCTTVFPCNAEFLAPPPLNAAREGAFFGSARFRASLVAEPGH